MKIKNLIALLLLCTAATKSYSAQDSFDGFHFSAPQDCLALLEDESEGCVMTEPKEWNSDEIERTKTFLTSLKKLLPEFTRQLTTDSPVRLFRHKYGVINYNRLYIKAPLNGWFDKDGIHLTDQAFTKDESLKNYLGHDSFEHVFLHELAHLFDHKLSISSLDKDFSKIAGWRYSPVMESLILSDANGSKIDETTISQINKKMRMLMMEGKALEAVKLTHEEGIKYGFPSTYSMSNHHECFAELTAWIFFDPKADTYIKPELINFMRTNILK